MFLIFEGEKRTFQKLKLNGHDMFLQQKKHTKMDIYYCQQIVISFKNSTDRCLWLEHVPALGGLGDLEFFMGPDIGSNSDLKDHLLSWLVKPTPRPPTYLPQK